MLKKFSVFIIYMLLFTFIKGIKAQIPERINWISFNQLSDSLQVKPKKVFVDFYADWCKFCKEMDKTTFQDPYIIKELNDNYYAVRMNVESPETVEFGGKTFFNKRIKKVNPVHEIALLLAGRKDRSFSLPAYVLFDENFVAKARYFQFLDSNALLKILK